MIQDFLHRSSELFDLDTSKWDNSMPLESGFIEFKDEYVQVHISRIYMVDYKVYSLSGGIACSERLFDPDTKMEAINNFFMENQEKLNFCIGRILNNQGIYADASAAGLNLGNGRSVSSAGLWFIYCTNRYTVSGDHRFTSLMKEEVAIACQSFSAIYGLILYILERNPSPEMIADILKSQEPVELQESPLVQEYINEEVTNRLNKHFFLAVSHLQSAEEIIQKAYVKDAIVQRENMNFLA